MHPIICPQNRLKMPLIGLWRTLFRQSLFDCSSSPNDTFLNRAVNELLRLYPVPPHETCRNVVCHRASLCYGLLYNHENLTQSLHNNLNEILGVINLTLLAQLSDISRAEKILNQNGADVYVSEENVRKNVRFPICLISGIDNIW